MTSPQEQFAKSLREGQEAVVQAMEAWASSAQKAFGGSTTETPAPSGLTSDIVIDQVFDFAEQMLAMQRRLTKSLAASAADAASQSNRG